MNAEPSRPGKNPAPASASRNLFPNPSREWWKEPFPARGDGPDGKMALRKAGLAWDDACGWLVFVCNRQVFQNKKQKQVPG